MSITADRTMDLCRNLPGLSWEHASRVMGLYASLDFSYEAFMDEAEKALRAGEEWAIQLSLALIRATDDE